VSDFGVGEFSAASSNVDDLESTGTTPTNLEVQEQDPISETRGFAFSPFLGSKTPVVGASSAALTASSAVSPTLPFVRSDSNFSDALTAPEPSLFVPYTVSDSEADSVSSQSVQSDFESVADGEDGDIDYELLNQFQRLGFDDSASDLDSVSGLEDLLNETSSLNLDSFDAVDLFELEQNLADLDLGYGTAAFISAAGKAKGAKKAKQSKPATKPIKAKAAKPRKGKGKRLIEEDEEDDVPDEIDKGPPSDPVPGTPTPLPRVKVPQGSIFINATTSLIPHELKPRYRSFARIYDKFLSTSQSILECERFLNTMTGMPLRQALVAFETQFGFIHPAGAAMIAIQERVKSVSKHNADNNME
ncbi:hypothetical protein HDU79_002220, partial [Rhizoclosmatium sp. JEL0117]